MTQSNHLPPEGFGDRIRQLRLRKDWSQEDLAKRTGTSRGQIGKYEREDSEPKLGLLSRIAEALETTTDFLITGREPAGSRDGRFGSLVPMLESCSAGLREPLAGFLGTLVQADMAIRLSRRARESRKPDGPPMSTAESFDAPC